MAGGLGWDGVSETGVDDINEVSECIVHKVFGYEVSCESDSGRNCLIGLKGGSGA